MPKPKLEYKKFAISRVDAFIRQIQLLQQVEFPYTDSTEALDSIENHFNDYRNQIANSVLTGTSLKSLCSRVFEEITRFHNLLGYLTNSADTRNSFEIYSPFRRLSAKILGDNTRLIISSEWEYYSPVNFGKHPELPDFVFIGLPVAESHNALIIPVNGHELGHSIWAKLDLSSKYRGQVQLRIDKEKFNHPERRYITDISLIKCAEYFCDFIGIGLFGPAYLYAFSYLLAPSITKKLNTSHPNAENRAKAMMTAAGRWDFEVLDEFEELFKTQLEGTKDRRMELLEETEDIALKLIDALLCEVEKLLGDKGLLYTKSNKYDSLVDDLLMTIPVNNASSLAEIVNVAWEVYFLEDKWKSLGDLKDSDKMDLINELTLKSFEILEIKQKLDS